MDKFLFMMGVSLLLAVSTVCVLLVNFVLERQKNTQCYIAMASIDIIFFVYVGVILLHLFGVL